MYQVYPVPPGAEPTQEKIPVYDIPLMDERGRHITDFVSGQDMAAWVTQGQSESGSVPSRAGLGERAKRSLPRAPDGNARLKWM